MVNFEAGQAAVQDGEDDEGGERGQEISHQVDADGDLSGDAVRDEEGRGTGPAGA